MKMKKLLSILIATTLLLSCNNLEKKGDTYVISGTADGVYNGIRVYLKTMDERGKETFKDTAVVLDGKFKFEGKVEVPEMWYLSVNSIEGYIPVMIENKIMEVNIIKDDISKSKITGSDSNEALSIYSEGVSSLTQKRFKLNSDYRMASQNKDSTHMDNYTQDIANMNTEMANYPFEFLSEHNDNYFSLFLIETLLKNNTSDLNRLIESYNSLKDYLKASDYGQRIYSEIQAKKRENERLAILEIGGTAPNFTAPDPNGKMISLNEIKGKVTIIDFWASWCGPCRRENPNVVKTYNKYHDKGLEIISVSLDRAGQKDKWLKAIEDDKLTWHHVSNLNYFNDPVAKQYNIQSIPSTYILDSEGKIAAKNLRGKALEGKVAELLN